MNRLWKLWVTVTLLYLLLARSHGGPGVVGVLTATVRWGIAAGQVVLDAWERPVAADIVITPCNLSGTCKDD